MDQKKIGSFLKELRKEKGLTQEQFAEILKISGRTISRWETGNNMPDISSLVEIAEFFDVTITEIINSERKSEIMKKEINENEVKETAEMLSDYASAEKVLLLKRVRIISVLGLISLLIGLIMEAFFPNSMIPIYEYVKGACLGFSVGSLITMVLYTTGTLEKLRKRIKVQPLKLTIRLLLAFSILLIFVSLMAALISTIA